MSETIRFERNRLLSAPDAVILEETKMLRVGYAMKRILRYNTKRDQTEHNESDAEHIFGLLFLAAYFHRLESFERPIDFAQTCRILAFHDFDEIEDGIDKPYHLKSAADKERQQQSVYRIFGQLPQSMCYEALECWLDYEHKRTIEGRFVQALDKVEPIFEMFDPINEKSPMRTHLTWEDHIRKKLVATEGFPVMRRFVDVISADMLRRGLFWQR